MLISPEQHADYQQQVVQQIAGRPGISASQFDAADKILEMIEHKDPKAFLAMTRCKIAYREWYEASAMLEKAVPARQEEQAETVLDRFRELRTQDDFQRKLLVGYLDKTYPSRTSW